MQNQAKAIQAFLLTHIPKHPGHVVTMTMEKFGVSRTTVLTHLKKLIEANQVIRTGTTKQTLYSLVGSARQQFSFSLKKPLDEFTVFSETIAPVLRKLVNPMALNILEYCITEIVNNAKDHSKGSKVSISIVVQKKDICIAISDDGVGVFQNLQEAFHFDCLQEALFELTKGKLTSNPGAHSGEGLFFTARACDSFALTANGLCYFRENTENDWTFSKASKKIGSQIELTLERKTTRVLKDLFIAYQDPEGDLSFAKTDVTIKLAHLYGERLISRSQAQRVARNLEKFTHVALDFSHVDAIGQGFVDQLFRVFQNQYPHIHIYYINANPDVEFMIKRTVRVK
ncbi:MAG: hypothetical protein A3J38_01470 [Gammaproteobacteria bacterium RIFCSPHIGHO2_12_FULL_45_9]|nr:MAG: hypothetical protein A3J38_01470 [Gammaproteobacteria bacterium RIFCSPHIGHO2_12_FULL_45_9]